MQGTQLATRKVSWVPRAQDRRREDRRDAFAGQMYRRTATLQKVIALATGQDPSWVSRQCHGNPAGAVARFYSLLERLTEHPKTDPSHLIAGGLIVIQEALGDLPFGEIKRRLAEVLGLGMQAQGESGSAMFEVLQVLDTEDEPAALERWENAMIKEASLELTAVQMSRARRMAL